MTLGQLIEYLKQHDQSRVVKQGIGKPHSYRGYYDQVAFEIVENVTVGQMLRAAYQAMQDTFTAWKGGDYTYNEDTQVWIAERGCCGFRLDDLWLQEKADELIAELEKGE